MHREVTENGKVVVRDVEMVVGDGEVVDNVRGGYRDEKYECVYKHLYFPKTVKWSFRKI